MQICQACPDPSHIYMDLLERLLPTVCPQLWANDPERVQSLSPENVVIPGFLSNFRVSSEVELGFESLQGHSEKCRSECGAV